MLQRACELTAGYTKQNCKNVAGIKSVIFFNYIHLENGAYTLDANGSSVDTFALANGEKGYRVKTDKESSFATQTPTGNRENNSYMVMQALTCILKDDTVETQELTSILGTGYFGAVVEQENGLNRVFGLSKAISLDTEENTFGQLMEDLNGSTLNFSGKELVKAPLISDVLVTALLAPAS